MLPVEVVREARVTTSNRDRWTLITLLALVTIGAWIYMLREARAMEQTGVCACLGRQLSGPDLTPWSVGTLVPLTIMWAEMMVAMMLPSATPMILLFAQIARRRSATTLHATRTGHFIGGYIAVWTGFSVSAAVAQWILHSASLLSPAMSARSVFLAAALLITAGVYQLSPWKNVCLTRCNSPLQFLLTEWRNGVRGAWIMGIRHGAFCVGCCALLMFLLFVGGVMNVLWIAVLTAIALVEKLAPPQWMFARVTGSMLIAWGLWMLVWGAPMRNA
jgi:predicted metal-binding membrane protein